MEQPMLSVDSRSNTTARTTAHLLPCRIHHDGPVGSTKSYWVPKTDQGGKRTAHFRGRELHGKPLKVPDGYHGAIMVKKDAPEPEAPKPGAPEVVDLDAEEEDLPLGALETRAEFEEMVIWGHESTAEVSSDPYVRGIEEWMKLSAQVRIMATENWNLDVLRLTLVFCRYIRTRKRGTEVAELQDFHSIICPAL
ncbi:hypothetical protein M406DRAFT_252304 [Cryphonectria parasitica EP155]|uniref:Uncharacterized protein n=1 Tax=Cryphonectria parasitica (strain ATCC 38755 / EP155) TaxID=660469 RepID=A0A9P5CQH5_CRYP1|nr:uncharacterized protein M406DRAFT_252304 [Cryphonectria parasitica EP155]KAF3767524.1 hypothetical protein M406DRAFT_252304 [Cryphonectria parasitica EP155]